MWFAKIKISCGNVLCSKQILRLNEQRLLPKKNFASHASLDNTCSATAHSPRSAQKMVGCGSTHNTFLQDAERIFPRKPETGKESNCETTTCSVTTETQKKSEVISCLPSVSDVNGLLQITSEKSEMCWFFCDSACIHSWISSKLASKLDVRGTPTNLTVHGIS